MKNSHDGEIHIQEDARHEGRNGCYVFAGFPAGGVVHHDCHCSAFSGGVTMPMTVASRRVLLAGNGVVPSRSVSLDPSNKGADIALSNNNLTATKQNASAWQTAKSTFSRSSGKFYFEMMFDAGSNAMIGVCEASMPNTTFLGNSGGGYGYANSSDVYNGGGSVANISAYAAGSFVCAAVDMTAGKIWFRSGSAGAWNGNSGSNNPATGLGGYTLGAGAWFPAISVFAAGDRVTVRFGGFVGSPPSGFLPWNSLS